MSWESRPKDGKIEKLYTLLLYLLDVESSSLKSDDLDFRLLS